MRVAFIGLAVAMLHIGVATAGPLANQSQVRVGVDADPSGNTATSISDIQDCREAGLDDSVQIDVFVEGVSDMEGLQFDLLYNPAVVNVVDVDVSSDNTFLASGSSGPFLDLSQFDDAEAMIDTDGTFTVAAADFGDTESGEGVLARISLRAIGTGQSDLVLSNVIITTPSATGTSPIEGVITTSAAIAIGESCDPPEQPPLPTAKPPTPTPGATEAVTGADGTVAPATGASDDPAGVSGGQGAGTDGDNGNSTTWIVIGVAAVAVALAAAGGAFAWQRGKQD